jgi:tetratricopeptide (TPR) repeat protein
MTYQDHIENVLSEFHIKEITSERPSLEDIQSYCQKIALNNDNHPNLMDSINGVIYENDINSPILKVMIYATGVTLFQLSFARIIPAENIKNAIYLFESAIKIDNRYFQAYNRLGDCWMMIEDGFSEAISYYKASLKYNHDIFNTDDAFIGDNYLKIGLCLLTASRKNDAIIFIKEAKNIVNDKYKGYQEIGFESWNDVFQFVENK